MKRFLQLLCGALIASLLLPLCACTITFQKEKFVEKTIDVVYMDESQNTTTTLRYYNDVPYTTIENYVSLLFRGRNVEEGRDKVTVEKDGNDYTVTTAGGASAVINAKNNTLKSDDFILFKNSHPYAAGMEGIVANDGFPWVKVDEIIVDTPKVFEVDFDDYNIDIHDDGNTVYLPLLTIADVFVGQTNLTSVYNGHDLFFYYYYGGEDYYCLGERYSSGMFDTPWSESYAEFNYNELCFTFDRLCGRDEVSVIENYYDLSKGLDAALSSDETTRTVKKYLKSTDKDEYLAGMQLLAFLVQNGGHNYYFTDSEGYYDADGTWHDAVWYTDRTREVCDRIVSEVKEKDPDTNLYKSYRGYKHYVEARLARSLVLGKPYKGLMGEETYTLVGDTAIIHIDSFLNGNDIRSEWEDYYSGKTDEIPFGENYGNSVGAVFYGLNKANEDGATRVVFDLTSNSGGFTDELLYIMSVFVDKAEFRAYSRMVDQGYTVKYRIDRNLDRVFDEKDDAYDLVGDKKIALLVSQNAFSCGSFATTVLHEYGVFTIGDICGGGNCCVYLFSDAFGLVRQVNMNDSQICTPSGKTQEQARVDCCDAYLPITYFEGTTVLDFTAFFDVNTLNGFIDARYALS